ncbi:hypothetical protein H5410_060368 [Solanum commersonii]|uniref:Polygalacturonase n=1 Tax=Solanum commersonii TaxID=4109 RepID=A0A9J5W513_SOLCO|nr:hypothetical protein H5410_060368 [Solanum commersonii]
MSCDFLQKEQLGPINLHIAPYWRSKGSYLLSNAYFFGQTCKSNAITINIEGTLIAPSDYNVIGKSGNWIKFERLNGVSIIGGTLDGQGTGLWTCKNSGKGCPEGATTLAFYNSNDIAINGCHNEKLQGVKISAPGNSPNTDGFHLQSSSDVTILNSQIGTGDDCISIGPGNSNLWFENIACGPGHGISIGSLGWEMKEAGVQNVTVKTSSFTGTENGVRVKTWSRPSNGFVRNVLFQHVVMNNLENPFIIDQNYCPSNGNCPEQGSGIKVSDITYEDVHGTSAQWRIQDLEVSVEVRGWRGTPTALHRSATASATEVAVKFNCSQTNPCNGIKLLDVKLSYKDHPAEASCVNAGGKASGLQQPTSCLQV